MKSALLPIYVCLSLSFDSVSTALAKGSHAAAFRDEALPISETGLLQQIHLTFPARRLFDRTSLEQPTGISLARNRRRASWGRAAAAGLGAVIGAVAGGVSGATIGGPAGAVAGNSPS